MLDRAADVLVFGSVVTVDQRLQALDAMAQGTMVARAAAVFTPAEWSELCELSEPLLWRLIEAMEKTSP